MTVPASLRVVSISLTTMMMVGHAFASQNACRTAFRSDSREEHMKSIRDFPLLTLAEVQQEVDLSRQILKSFFVDTKIFLGKTPYGTQPTSFGEAEIKARLKENLVMITADLDNKERSYRSYDTHDLAYTLQRISQSTKAKIRLARRYKISEAAAEDLVEAALLISKDLDAATAVLSMTLSTSGAGKVDADSLDRAQARREISEEARDALKKVRSHYSRVDAKIGIALSAIPVTWLVEVGLAATGTHIPMTGLLGPHSVDSTFVNELFVGIGNPLILTSAVATGIATHTQAPLARMKAAFYKFKESRERKKLTKAVVPDIPEIKATTFERTDAAFEKGWETWRAQVRLDEENVNPDTLNALSTRLNHLQLALPPLRLVELPNGESYQRIVDASPILTPERLTAFRDGFDRKYKQLEVLTRETEILQADVREVARELRTEEALGDPDSAQMIKTDKNLLVGLQSSLDNAKTSIRQARERYAILQQGIASGEAAFKGLIRNVFMEGGVGH